MKKVFIILIINYYGIWVYYQGWITSQGWLSFWSYCTLIEADTTLAYLAMLGYCMKPENQLSGVQGEIKLKIKRNLIKC